MTHRGDSIESKKQRLFDYLRDMHSIAVGFSGGVDSTLLLAASQRVLGGRAIAMTAKSPTHPKGELDNAVAMAAALGVQHIIFETDEMQDPAFTANGPERCYHCKIRMFAAMRKAADEAGIETLAHGANVDDLSDHRPGLRAAEELGVVAPLSEAGLTKSDIRQLARMMGLPNWDRPAMACLATRVPYGVRIKPDMLETIAHAESFVRQSGVANCRVRHHGNLARIEIDPAEMQKIMGTKTRQKIIDGLHSCGYKFVCLDLEGYVSGKMNREL